MMLDDNIRTRFWAKVERRGADDCWPWTANRSPQGYGMMSVGRAPRTAHSIAVAIDGRTVPSGMCIDHVCRNRLCVNPKHLEVVTVEENARRSVFARWRPLPQFDTPRIDHRKQPASPSERLEQWSERRGDCLVWTGGTDKNGYGITTIFRPAKRVVRAHRLAFELAHGPIPEGMFVCHSCDNPSCIEPSHLFAGTPRDNTQDMLSKGRRKRSRRDTAHHYTKIAHKERAVVRMRRANGETCVKIAADFGVSQSLISQICRRVGSYSEKAEAEAERLRDWSLEQESRAA